MVLMKKNDSNDKKEKYKKEPGEREDSKKALVAGKEKKNVVKKDPGKAAAKKDKVNRLEQAKRYLRGVLSELKKVHWLSAREVVIYTAVVLVAVLFVGSLIWLFDSLLSAVLRMIMPS